MDESSFDSYVYIFYNTCKYDKRGVSMGKIVYDRFHKIEELKVDIKGEKS